jgi:hypothetical protein
LVTYLGVKENNRNYFTYISSKSSAWWWNKQNLINMNLAAGFFPLTIENIEKYCELMLSDMVYVDILGSWLQNENYFRNELKDSHFVDLICLEPFWTSIPWTNALQGKKVLVIHPYADSIRVQYRKRKLFYVKNNYKIIKNNNKTYNTDYSSWIISSDKKEFCLSKRNKEIIEKNDLVGKCFIKVKK